ncbi:hypothetical protein T01_6809, partial [Trichinella spiralis]
LQFTRMLMRKFHSVSTHRPSFVFCRCKLPKFYDMQLKKNPSVLVERNKCYVQNVYRKVESLNTVAACEIDLCKVICKRVFAPGNCILTLKIWSCDKQMSVENFLSLYLSLAYYAEVQNFSSKRRLFTATGSLQVSFAYWLVVVKICQSLCLQQRQQQDDFVSEMMMVALPRKFIKSKDDL